MLFKDEIITLVKEMNFPDGEYWITSGAGLVLHDIKEATQDIDMGCTTNLVEYFIDKGCKYRFGKNNVRIIEVNDKIEMIENWLVDEIVFIHGLPVGSISSIKKQKILLAREKDFEDIKLIDKYIKRTTLD